MTPLDLFEKELGIDFPVKLVNDHVVANSQINIFNLTQSPSMMPFDFTMRGYHQNNMLMMQLAISINALAQSVGPGTGVLVFFPSYKLMRLCFTTWNKAKFRFDRPVNKEVSNAGKMERVF